MDEAPAPKRRPRRWMRVVVYGSLAVVALLAGAALVLGRTNSGRAWVLQEVLERARAGINGDIQVDRVAGGGSLFGGFSLHGVRVVDPSEQPVLVADSAEIGYDLIGLITRRQLTLRLYGPDFTLARTSEGAWNVAALLRSSDDPAPAPGKGAPSPSVEPTSPGDSARTEFGPSPGGLAQLTDVRITGGRVRIERAPGKEEWFVLDSIDAVLPSLALGGSDAPDEGRVAFLSLRAHLADGPLRVQDLRATWARTESAFELDARLLQLPGSRGTGFLVAAFPEDDEASVRIDLDVEELALQDLQGLDSRIPSGVVKGGLTVGWNPGQPGTEWMFEDLEARFQDGGAVDGFGGLQTGSQGVQATGVELALDQADLALLRPWIPASDSVLAPWTGARLDGRVAVDGPFRSLRWDADVTALLPGDVDPVELRVQGTAGLAAPFRAGGLTVTAAPLSPEWLAGVLPALGRLDTQVALEGTVDGALGRSLTMDGVVRSVGEPAESVVEFSTTLLEPVARGYRVVGELRPQPLALGLVAGFAPAAGLRGTIQGRLPFVGRIDSLQLTPDLQTSGGPFTARVTADLTDPTALLFVDGTLQGLDVSALSTTVPEPTLLEGRVSSAVRLGPRPTGSFHLDLAASQVGPIEIFRLGARVRADGTYIHVDSLDARTTAADVRGQGALGLRASGSSGTVDLELSTPNLADVRPLLLGERVIAADTLSDLARELLAAQGIDPDTLRSSDDVQMAGRASGTVRLAGRLEDWTARGQIYLAEAVYGHLATDSATVELRSFDWPERSLELTATLDSTFLWDRAFATSEADLQYGQGRGRLALALVRSPQEDVRLRGGFTLGDQGSTVDLDQATIRLEGERWNLGGPSRMTWGPDGVEVQNFTLVRPATGGLRLTIDGALSEAGDGDLRVSAVNLDLARMARLLQVEDGRVEGLVTSRLRVQGTPTQPRVDGTLEATNVRYRAVEVGRLEGSIELRETVLTGDLEARIDDRIALAVDGTAPLRLTLPAQGSSFSVAMPEEDVDVTIAANDVPLAAVLGFFEQYEDVVGTLEGEVEFAGTPSDLEPRGTVRVTDGATTLRVFGIRPSDVDAELRLSTDGTVAVEGTFRERGIGRVSGTIDLNPLTDPAFDLDFEVQNFRAVARRDVAGQVSGDVHLGGSFQQPRIRGQVVAEEGTLFIDEFVRSAGVVDLSDRLFQEAFADDTLFARPRELDEISPFVANLLANVSITMEQDTWLRSQRINQAMNVELEGTVDMTYDRGARSAVLVGTLQAVRGTYTTVGRSFEVREGEVTFVGTPEVNPNLDFTAVNRLRTDQGPLDVTATVQGTLLQPTVRLTSDDQALSESDLYSYLVFGRPSYALSRDQQNFVSGARDAGLNFTLNTIAAQLGGLLPDDSPIDYLNISTSEVLPQDAAGGRASTVAGTVVGVGKYVANDLFVGVEWRPFGREGAADRDAFSGRLEWRLEDGWSFEAFAEDRTWRNSFTGFDRLGFDFSKIYGLQLLWESGHRRP